MNKLINLSLAALLLFSLSACETNDAPAENAATTQTEESMPNAAEETTQGISFHEGTWSAALAKAKEENKLVFLDISASWCGPCKQLKKTTFTDATVGEFYNDKFINVEVDGEVGEGIMLAQNYKLQGYPSLYFINPNGEVVQEVTGYLNANQFIEFGKSVVK